MNVRHSNPNETERERREREGWGKRESEQKQRKRYKANRKGESRREMIMSGRVQQTEKQD